MLGNRHRFPFVPVAIALLGAALAGPAGAQKFNVTDLGTLGGNQSKAFAISAQSHVVGQALTSGGATHAFLYVSSMSDLGTLTGGTSSAALAVNSTDQVAGQSTVTGGAQHAFVLVGGTLFDLGTFGGATSIANALNNGAQTAGGALNAGGNMHAFVHSGTGALVNTDDLGTLGGLTSIANALNDSGVAGGQSATAGGALHAFVWDSVNGMQDLGTLGGANSNVLGLNGNGLAVGQADTASASHAFYFDSGVMTDLGTLGGTNSAANAVNNNNQIVGQSDTGSAQHAFLWDNNHGMVDLNTLLPNGSGWVLTSATGIDDLGEVVGFGTIGGQTHAFLLTPVKASVTLNPNPLIGGAQTSTLTVTLPSPAPSGGTSVALHSSNNGLAVFANNGGGDSSITIPAGEISATTIINTAIVGADSQVTISATPSGQGTVSDVLTLKPLLAGLSLKPASVVGGAQTSTVTVVFNAAAPAGGVNVALHSSNNGLAIFANNGGGDSTVTVAAGAKTAQMVIDTGAVGANTGVNISASLAGLTFTKTLTLTPWLKSFTLNPTSVIGSQHCTGTVTINGMAPGPNGINVNLHSSDNGLAVFDNNGGGDSVVNIPAGSSSATFVIDTSAVKANKTVNISATLAGLTQTQTLTLTPWLKSLVLNPKTVIGGCQHTTGTVTLNAPAPPGGVNVTLHSTNNGLAIFDNNGGGDTTVTVPAGALSVTFVVDTFFVGSNQSVTIDATLAGLTKPAKLTITPALSNVTLSPSTVIGGCQTTTGTVTLFAPAPPGGVTIGLHSTNNGLAVFANNGGDSTVTVPAGANSITFLVNTAFVGSTQTVNINGTLANLTKSATLTLQAANASLSLSPATVVGGCQQSTGTVTLNAPAPSGGVTFALHSSNNGVAVFDNNGGGDSTVTIAGGATSVSFILDTGFVGANTNVSISATFASLTKTTTLTVIPALVSLSLNPSTVSLAAGGHSTGTVTLAAPALGNVNISLHSSNNGVAVFDNNGGGDTTVTIPAGATSVTFIIDGTHTGTANISATLAGLTFTQKLTVNP